MPTHFEQIDMLLQIIIEFYRDSNEAPENIPNKLKLNHAEMRYSWKKLMLLRKTLFAHENPPGSTVGFQNEACQVFSCFSSNLEFYSTTFEKVEQRRNICQLSDINQKKMERSQRRKTSEISAGEKSCRRIISRGLRAHVVRIYQIQEILFHAVLD